MLKKLLIYSIENTNIDTKVGTNVTISGFKIICRVHWNILFSFIISRLIFNFIKNKSYNIYNVDKIGSLHPTQFPSIMTKRHISRSWQSWGNNLRETEVLRVSPLSNLRRWIFNYKFAFKFWDYEMVTEWISWSYRFLLSFWKD